MLPDSSIWVGLRDYDGTDTQYHWLDGTLQPDKVMWHPGQPNGNLDACVMIHTSNLLADRHCSDRYSFICEVDTGKLHLFYSGRPPSLNYAFAAQHFIELFDNLRQ